MKQIDAKSVQFLNAVRYYAGTANISEIRGVTGLNRNEANYRFNKLAEMELIDITTEESPGDLPDRKVAHLTGHARREIERGLGSASKAGLVISDEPEATEVSRERFRELENKLERLTESQQATSVEAREVRSVREQVDDLEADLSDFEEYVYEWHEAAETYLRALRTVVERYVPGVNSLSDFFDDVKSEESEYY
jgi:DNA-binding Lrp family transcriptional regulator